MCQCDCGNIKEICINDLTSGNVSSCGCLKESSYELRISQFLDIKNIKYKQEYSFENLKSEKNKKLRFDFALFNQKQELIGLIEYHGEQHYLPIDFFGGEEAFTRRQLLDKQKENYCNQNNIPLLILNKNNKKNYQEQILNFIGESFNGKI